MNVDLLVAYSLVCQLMTFSPGLGMRGMHTIVLKFGCRTNGRYRPSALGHPQIKAHDKILKHVYMVRTQRIDQHSGSRHPYFIFAVLTGELGSTRKLQAFDNLPPVTKQWPGV